MSDAILAALTTYGKIRSSTKTSVIIEIKSSDRVAVLQQIAEELRGDYKSTPVSASSIGFTQLGAMKVYVKAEKTNDGNKTALQECAVLLCLDIFVSGNYPTIDLISSYENSGKLEVSEKIENIIKFLLDEKSWREASIVASEQIFNKFKKYNLKKYTFHRGSKLFTQIKSIGSKLAGISADKWNPSDIFLISNEVKAFSKNDFNHIMEFNRFIAEDLQNSKPIIGISLKKSDKLALHGAASVSTILTLLNSTSKIKSAPSNPSGQLSKTGILTASGYLQKLKNNPLVYIHGKHEDRSFNDLLSNLRFGSVNFNKSFFNALEFLTIINDANFENNLKYGILLAMSITAVSCSHYKASGSSISIVKTQSHIEYFNSIKINRVRIKLNGENDTIIDYSIGGINKKAQIRSKNPTVPQVMLVSSNESHVPATLISKFKK